MIFLNYLRGRRSTTPPPARMLQHLGNTAQCGTFTPEDDGPVVIAIGSKAPESKVRRLATRHGLQFEDLLKFQVQ